MRKLLLALLASLFLLGGSASLAAAQTDATPEPGAKGAASDSNPVDPAIGDSVTYYTEDGQEAGVATVTGIERGWDEYDEFYEPETGTEFVAFTVTVESTIERGAIDVSDFDFSLQTTTGALWQTAFVQSETVDPPMLEDDISLAAGDSEEFTLIFQVYEDEPLAHLYWQPEGGILITLAQLEGE